MYSLCTAAAAAIAALAALPTACAHGFVSGIVAGGKYYPGGDPVWIYNTKPDSAGWYAENQDNGFVAPSAYGSSDITCHKKATPGNLVVEAQAGSSIELQWNTWPESHHGPIVNYLARTAGSPTTANKDALNFFKIDEGGLVDGSSPPGKWATDDMMSKNNTYTLTLPSNLQGTFVLRHEIIALHSAGNADGAQNYPQCINLKITGSGNAHPCREGADCRKGTALYTASEKGILFNIYTALTSYPIPGPKVAGRLSKRVARVFRG